MTKKHGALALNDPTAIETNKDMSNNPTLQNTSSHGGDRRNARFVRKHVTKAYEAQSK